MLEPSAEIDVTFELPSFSAERRLLGIRLIADDDVYSVEGLQHGIVFWLDRIALF